MEEKKWYCYILQSTQDNHGGRTYIGKTNNPHRRLRQHNGEICGGARYTRGCRPYRHICIIGGFQSERDALRFEWKIKHVSVSRVFRGVKRRFECINRVVNSSWMEEKLIEDTHLVFYIVDDFFSVSEIYNEFVCQRLECVTDF